MKQTAELLRARLRGLFGDAKKEQQEAGHRSGQTGAGGGAAGRVRGIDGQTAALAGADQEDGRADRCDGVQAVRADRGGGCHSRRKRERIRKEC